GYSFAYGAEYEEQQDAFRQMTWAVILAITLVYMVMAAQFESFRDPFIILFSIPVAAVGVVFILMVTNTSVTIQALLGMIVLVGIVVNNAIVLVDYINQLRRDHGMKLHESVIHAGQDRLRPIIMTTATTVLGLVPMAIGIGEGAELQAPLARVIIGGLTASTMITLLLIPVLYMIFEQFSERARERSAGRVKTVDVQPSPASGD
ncbi:MAG: efflux RND transporter permease subunit, partial [Bryobacterales bacterium]|nr:efflux RND transporter permease subunit [Bryobacterales bacterium]